MNYSKWLKLNTENLSGKTVAITGSTGGLGREICQYLASLGANFILLDRNHKRSLELALILKEQFNVEAYCINIQLDDMSSVKNATNELLKHKVDYFIHNAGAYSIPRKICETGFDNVFQINFISPYYIIKKILPTLKSNKGRVVVVSSIAHNYSKLDENDIDFKTRQKASLVYGNSKRFLTYSLHGLFENEKQVGLSVTHPGIAFTNITAHYPKLIFAIIKYPMKLIFHSTKMAALSVVYGVFNITKYNYWIGPKYFNVWGMPRLKPINTATRDEVDKIFNIAENIFTNVDKE